MKKVLTVCIMLASLVFLAYAGSDAVKQADNNARSLVNETVQVEVKKAEAIDTPVLLKADGTKPNYEINFENLGSAPSAPVSTFEPYADIKAAFEAGDVAAYKELLASETTPRGPSRSLDQGGEDCTDAVAITALPYCDEGTTVNAISDWDTPCAFSSGAPDVVYSYTPAADETFVASTSGSGFDTQLYVVTDCADVAGYAACDDDGGFGLTSCVTVTATANVTYYIIIDGYSGNSGAYVLKVDIGLDCQNTDDCSGPPPVPANDLCADAEALTLPASVTATNVGATDDVTPFCGTSSPNQAIWYSVVGDGNTLTASTCNAGGDFNDTKIQVFTGCCDALQCVAGNDDGCSVYSGVRSTVTWCSQSGLTYLIAVGGYGSNEGEMQLDVTSDGIACDPAETGCLVDFFFTAPFTNSSTTCGACNNCDLSPNSEDHTYEVYIPADGEWTFSLCGSGYDTKIYIGDDCCTSFINNDDNSSVCGPYPQSLNSHIECLTLTAGYYYVAVEGFSSNCGDYILDVSGPCTAPEGRCCYEDHGLPACVVTEEAFCLTLGGSWTSGVDCDTPCPTLDGENCDNPVDVIPGLPYSDSGSTVGKIDDYDAVCPYSGSTSGDVAYHFTPAADVTVTLSLCNSAYDTKLYVYDVTNVGVGPGLQIACNDDFCPGFMSEIQCLPLTANTLYCIIVDGYGGDEGDYVLDMTACVTGRCCYGDPFAPLCDYVLQDECIALGGDFDEALTCLDPCPVCTVTPPNDQCADLIDCPVAAPNAPAVINGNNDCATGINECLEVSAGVPYEIVWECFTTTECGLYSVAYCGSEGTPNGFVSIWDNCDCAGSTYDGIPPFDNTSCGDGNFTVNYVLAAGTYYVPIHPDLGPLYTVTVTYLEPCFACTCCDTETSHLADPEPDLPISVTLDPTCLTINVPIEYHITDLNVCVDLDHTYIGDLEITLLSPEGTLVKLFDNHCFGDNDLPCFTFDDEAAGPIDCNLLTQEGESVTPFEALSLFNDENAVGDWILCVEDFAGGDDGSLHWACLTFDYDYILSVELNGFDAIASDRSVTLSWETASESDNERFDILRDSELVGSVTAENSATGSDYRFVDNGLVNGTTYDYTVVSVTVSGATEEVFTISATPTMTAATITEYALHQNFPNPFNPGTSISFDLVDGGFVSLRVYNLLGQEVASLVNGTMDAGRHIVNFQADNLPSGLYLYRIEANGFSAQKKMVLMK